MSEPISIFHYGPYHIWRQLQLLDAMSDNPFADQVPDERDGGHDLELDWLREQINEASLPDRPDLYLSAGQVNLLEAFHGLTVLRASPIFHCELVRVGAHALVEQHCRLASERFFALIGGELDLSEHISGELVGPTGLFLGGAEAFGLAQSSGLELTALAQCELKDGALERLERDREPFLAQLPDALREHLSKGNYSARQVARLTDIDWSFGRLLVVSKCQPQPMNVATEQFDSVLVFDSFGRLAESESLIGRADIISPLYVSLRALAEQRRQLFIAATGVPAQVVPSA